MRMRFFPDLPEASETFPMKMSQDEIDRGFKLTCDSIGAGFEALLGPRSAVDEAMNLCEQENHFDDKTKIDILCAALVVYVEALRFFRVSVLQLNDESILFNAIIGLNIGKMKVTDSSHTSQQAYAIMSAFLKKLDEDLLFAMKNRIAFLNLQRTHRLSPPKRSGICTLL
jgi:hypothetical protein